MLQRLRRLYDGNIRLCPPYTGAAEANFPPELLAVLQVSNGVEEVMAHPRTGEVLPIGWVLYPYRQILEETSFLAQERGPEGWVFSTNGAGDPYLLKADGTVTCYDATDGSECPVADSLERFYTLPEEGPRCSTLPFSQ